MFLQQIKISHFRNLGSASLSLPQTGLCIVSGPNGSGKTSLLEALYTLTYGKSFRTSEPEQLIQNDSAAFALFATLKSKESEQETTIGVQRDRKRSIIARCMGEPEKFSEIARMLPLRIISPTEAYTLINGGPEYRRRFLDWGVFHVKHSYWDTLKQVNRLIKQKSAALKMRCSDQELAQWNQMLCDKSMVLDQLRREYVEKFTKIFTAYQLKLPAIKELVLSYFPGWDENKDSLFTQLSTAAKQERQQGHCLIGPHRAELQLNTSFGSSKDQLSRGRQKMLAIALYLAQGELLYREKDKHPLYLIDDFSSELDQDGQQLLIDAFALQDKQVIITTLEAGHTVLDRVDLNLSNVKRYSIIEGKIYPVD